MKQVYVVAAVVFCGCFDLNQGHYLFELDAGTTEPANGSCSRACQTPPTRRCVSPTTLEAFPNLGVCSTTLGCAYSPVVVTCSERCEQGSCTGEPCAGVFCDRPPATRCADASHATVFDAPGSCAQGICAYLPRQVECPGGCVDGQCAGNACAGVSCQSPAPAVCLDPQSLRTFSAPGQCSEGRCRYSPVDFSCASGCRDGACVNDPCSGRVCAQPPASVCVDALVLRTFAASGSCGSDGRCAYAHVDVPCTPGSCQSGRCVPPSSCSAATCPQGCCSGDQCVAFAAQDAVTCGTAGASCAACSQDWACEAGQCHSPDACAVNHGGCDAHATCANSPSGPTCTCNSGWSGDGRTCTPVVDAGTTRCDSHSCAGCCDTNLQCQTSGSEVTCGLHGDRCINCPATTSCTSYGGCTAAVCSPTTCPTGCCAPDGRCVDGTDLSSCGGGGQACRACATACVNRACTPLTPPFNDGGVAFDRCENARPLSEGVLLGETTVGYSNDYVDLPLDDCDFGSGGDKVYQVSVPSMKRLDLRFERHSISSGGVSLVMSPSQSCLQPVVCSAFDRLINGTLGVLSWYNASAQPQNGYLIVDEDLGSEGTYDLTLKYLDVPRGDRCERPIELHDGVPEHADTSTFTDDFWTSQGLCSSINGGKDMVFAIDVPGRAAVTFTVTPLSSALDTSISLSATEDDCARRYCESNRSTGGPGQIDTLGWLNSHTSPRRAFVVIDSQYGASGAFDITATLSQGLCDATNCWNGCCFQNQCISGIVADEYCGANGAECVACTAGKHCKPSGVCQ